jgi:hypothetical protein
MDYMNISEPLFEQPGLLCDHGLTSGKLNPGGLVIMQFSVPAHKRDGSLSRLGKE